MKVVLANPPWEVENGYGCRTNSRWPHIRKDKHLAFPIYLGYTASLLEKAGIEVKVIDAVAQELNNKRYAKAVEDESPDMVFVETSTPTINIDLESTRLLSGIGSKIFMLGAHATVFQRELLKENSFIDGTIRGEFELTIKDIASGKNLGEVPGLTFRNNGRVVQNHNRDYINDLDKLPFSGF